MEQEHRSENPLGVLPVPVLLKKFGSAEYHSHAYFGTV